MGLELIDSHCHLDVAEFDTDRDAVIERARSVGVSHIVVPAIARQGWTKLRRICEAAPSMLHAAYGLHPMFLDDHNDVDDIGALELQLQHGDAVAVGECGLDYYVDGLDRERQRDLFEAQLDLSKQFDLPVIVHARRAVQDVIASLQRVGDLRGVIHSYAGSLEQAQQLEKIGFMIGLGGPVTYDGAHKLRRLAAEIPLTQLLLETDAPDQPDAEHRGQRNEPARLSLIATTIAALRGTDPSTVANATSENVNRLFGLTGDPT